MNLGEIRTLMDTTLNRDDMTDAQANDWITMAIRRIQRWIKIPSQETTSSFTIASGYVGLAIPADYLSTKALYVVGDEGGPLTMVSIAQYQQLVSDYSQAGVPKFYTRKGSYLQCYPEPQEDQVIELVYWAEHGDMLVDTDEPVLARIAPDLIMYTALIYAGNYYVDERAPGWKEMAGEFAAELESQAEEAEFSGLNMAVQPVHQGGNW